MKLRSSSQMNLRGWIKLGKLIIAKYIRLSMDEAQSDSLSIENQRLLLDQYLLDSDMDDGEVLEFVDNGYSGINFERPAVQQLLELVREGKVHCILVKDFSRFGRDALETGYFIERVFPLFHLRFIAVSDGYDSFEHDGGTGGMEVSFKFLVNEYYSRDLSMKIRSVKHEKALRGEYVTKNCAFGYMLDEQRNMVIDPNAEETVRFIFEMYANKKSLVEIAKCLYEKKCLVPAARKKQREGNEDEKLFSVWNKSVLLQILRNEEYLGTYIAGKTRVIEVGSKKRTKNAEEDWIRIPGHHPAIISQQLFTAVQEQLSVKGDPLRKRKIDTTKRYSRQMASPLESKVICGHCGHTMCISATKNAAFHCRFTLPAPDAACHKLRILKSELEEVVLKSIKRQAKIVVKAGLDAADVDSVCSPIAAEYMDEIERLQSEKQRLYELLVTGSVCPDQYKAQKAVIGNELANAKQVQTTILNESKKNASNVETVEVAKKALVAGELSETLVDLLVDKVAIYPDNSVEIIWKLSGFMICAQ